MDINEVTKKAFNFLGENGLIRAANHHSCPQCTQEYKDTSDINNNADPAAIVGVDNDQAVFPMVNSNPESSTSKFALGENVQTEVTENGPAVVKMVVMDGIVMGPQHCAFGDCTADLANTRGGVFCSIHEI